MKMVNKKQRVKGFTLTELIVVIAIITILAAILAPSMTTYFWKSRVKTANSNAKMVYNAAQTAVQTYISADRTAATKSLFDTYSAIIISYSVDTHSFTYATTATKPTTNAGDQCIADVVNYVNTVVTDASENNWAVYVNKYTVEACAFANSTDTNCVGYYSVGPITVERINNMNNSSGAPYGTNYDNAYTNLLIDKAALYAAS